MLKVALASSSIIRVQTWDAESVAPAAVADALGLSWPKVVGAVASGRADVICLGPTDWLVIAIDRDATPWVPRLNAALEGTTFRATDVSQALVRIQIGVAEVRDLLAKGCSLDLHPPLFPVGRAARTRFAGMPVIVRCTGSSTFELVVTQSYADFLLSWLADSELEFSSSSA